MVFWSSCSIYNTIHSLFTNQPFISTSINKESVSSPTGKSCEIYNQTNADHTILNEIQTYLRTHFGVPPLKPVLQFTGINPLCENDIILIVRDISEKIVGCIRYHYIGKLLTAMNKPPMFVVDCFCVHPEWRKKGVGDYLLTELNRYVNSHKIPYSLFLKEGGILPIIQLPLYKGIYVYRELHHTTLSADVIRVNTEIAYRFLKIYSILHANTLIIGDKTIRNQNWVRYKKGVNQIWACIQDTYQVIKEKGKDRKLGWITAWLECGEITDEIRSESSIQISNLFYPQFDFIWMNQEWSGNNSLWKVDGTFYFYTYQWDTCLKMHPSYCMIQ